MVVGTIVAGGITRITNSGLSMVRWDLHKIFPPVTEEQWKKEFHDYKNFPQFKNDFPDMTLTRFKEIYFWEYVHR